MKTKNMLAMLILMLLCGFAGCAGDKTVDTTQTVVQTCPHDIEWTHECDEWTPVVDTVIVRLACEHKHCHRKHCDEDCDE